MALGGQQKVSLALANGGQAVLGPHLGDLNTLAALTRFEQHVQQLQQLYGIDASSSTLVADMHPEYRTTRWAEAAPRTVVAVQHHHAHIAATMLEHGWLDRQVLGVAFDGTGSVSYTHLASRRPRFENARLVSEETPLIARCHACDRESTLDAFDFRCPTCGESLQIISGDQFELVSAIVVDCDNAVSAES